MRLPGFFKTPKYKSFDYKPRYYNARTEDLLRKINQTEETTHSYASRIHNAYERKWSHEKKNSNTQSGFRLIIIIAALVVLSVYILLF